MQVFLAGRVEALNSDMKLFLAASGGLWEAYFPAEHFAHAYILQSFYYADEFTEKIIIPNAKDFMLDSGAFSFMQGAKAVDWNEYVERYAAFINRNKVEKFFELDIDSVTGYDEVKRLREKLENLTGRQSIPVWHKSRGFDEYKNLCDRYPYIAIGGIAIKDITKREYPVFTTLIREAHKRGTKVHGLGFTQLSLLEKYHFDSVDSSAWTTGNRFGYVYHFNGQTMTKTDTPKGHRLADAKRVALHNFCEWKKFQDYAEKHF